MARTRYWGLSGVCPLAPAAPLLVLTRIINRAKTLALKRTGFAVSEKHGALTQFIRRGLWAIAQHAARWDVLGGRTGLGEGAVGPVQ